MLDGFKILTVTHREVQLEAISQFVIPQSAEELSLQHQLQQLKDKLQIQELLYVSTCNRALYLFYKNAPIKNHFVKKFFRTINPTLDEAAIHQNTVIYEGKEAIIHLYEVASSIDSLVVGEREIIRQIRESYSQCNEWGLTGDNTRLLMKYLVQASKAVYSNTRIGEKPVSVVSLAMHLLKRRNLAKNARILLVGAGQTNTLVAKFLVKQGYQQIDVFNRSLHKAAILAQKVSGKAYPLQAIMEYEKGFDCLIVCTGATKAIIGKEEYTSLLQGETSQKIVVDLSIPNNVSKAIIQQFSTDYIDIEELKELAELNLSLRKQEIGLAKMVLQKQFEDFEKAYKGRQIELMMREVPAQIKAIKQKAMTEVFKKDLEDMDENTRQLFEKMMTYMEKKCISIPMKVAKELAKK